MLMFRHFGLPFLVAWAVIKIATLVIGVAFKLTLGGLMIAWAVTAFLLRMVWLGVPMIGTVILMLIAAVVHVASVLLSAFTTTSADGLRSLKTTPAPVAPLAPVAAAAPRPRRTYTSSYARARARRAATGRP